jgi:hypothetical protein
MSDLANEISGLFLLNGYTWMFDGEEKPPTEDDIQTVLDKFVEALYDEEPGTQAEVRWLIVKKRADHKHDVFILAGTIGDDDE